MIAAVLPPVVTALALLAAACWALRARGRRVQLLLLQLDGVRTDLRTAQEERDVLRQQLANVNGSLAHALRAQQQLEYDRDDAEAEAHRAFETFEADMREMRAIRDRAIRDRDAQVARSDELARRVTELEQELPGALAELRRLRATPGHVATCADLDEFFDEELSAVEADAFRDHLATCERCQRALDGRMQESVVTQGAAPAAPGAGQ